MQTEESRDGRAAATAEATFASPRVAAQVAAACIGGGTLLEVVPVVADWTVYDRGVWLVQVLAGSLLVGAHIAWIYWFHLAYRNLETFGHRRSRPQWWTVASWMIPIMNLVVPFQMTVETWRASLPPDGNADAPLRAGVTPTWLGLWWVGWLGSRALGRVISPSFGLAVPHAVFTALFLVVTVGAAGLAIHVLLRITDLQERSNLARRGVVVPRPF